MLDDGVHMVVVEEVVCDTKSDRKVSDQDSVRRVLESMLIGRGTQPTTSIFHEMVQESCQVERKYLPSHLLFRSTQ